MVTPIWADTTFVMPFFHIVRPLSLFPPTITLFTVETNREVVRFVRVPL
jgi:hypothetical protein